MNDKKMNSWKIVAVVAAPLIAGLALTGCSASDNTSAENNQGSTSVAPAPQSSVSKAQQVANKKAEKKAQAQEKARVKAQAARDAAAAKARAAAAKAREAAKAQKKAAQARSCDPGYQGACVPNVSYDLDCADIGTSVRVVGRDQHGLDGDNDGVGCEWS
jgi:membrane protein involved in colicin uptake